MKVLFSLFLFIFLPVSCCFSQDSAATIVHINKIPAEGILLDKGWKFHQGDNADWAKPEYDDRAWQSINPTLDIHDSLPQIPKSGICWFRLHFSVDSTINRQLALNIYQSGTSEFYLNGHLIAHFGVLSTNPAEIRAYDPWGKPVLIPVTKSAGEVLAVRFALQPGVSYTIVSGDNNPAFRIQANTLEGSMQQYYQPFSSGLSVLEFFRLGVFFILAILHLAFFLFYPSQKANLHFCLYALIMAASQFIGVRMLVHTVEYKFYYYNLAQDLNAFSYLFLMTALYMLLEKKREWVFWVLTSLIVIGILLSACTYVVGVGISALILPNLIGLEITRIAFKAVIAKKRGAWIILGGAIGFLVFSAALLFLFVFGLHDIVVISNFTATNLVFNFVTLSIPVSTSIYLGLDFAFTNRSLNQKLSEVEDLSQKNIAQEQEKQQILASQNEMLEKQVIERTVELSKSLKELKETQTQLIQSEKMASLGELTAGIAHEIQNPLNFVNNFSEVNKELLAEMSEEISKGNLDEVRAIAKDISENEEKINHHGKRADSIVKGMLQHSKSGSGSKELTNISALADEYMRLSYHGLRARDKSFNAELITHFDANLPKINIIPQDIGRVLLNLFNNAFYAVNQKQKIAGTDYKPEVSVTAYLENGNVIIKVKDNGVGIPDVIKEKIMQPFFTTKPAGEGTGLGLSLTYDMVTKGHRGSITVETKEGEFTEFIVTLPTKS